MDIRIYAGEHVFRRNFYHGKLRCRTTDNRRRLGRHHRKTPGRLGNRVCISGCCFFAISHKIHS